MRGTELARRQDARVATWKIRGRAQIDERPAVVCELTIGADGTWSATVATFTFAGQVDLMFVATDGGHFCGPAFVAGSRASQPLSMGTDLIGSGPLLVVAPSDDLAAIESSDLVDGEVVE